MVQPYSKSSDLKQQGHDAVSVPDFRDDRRVRLELNQSMFCDTLYVRANMSSKMPMAWTRIIFSFQLCMSLSIGSINNSIETPGRTILYHSSDSVGRH